MRLRLSDQCVIMHKRILCLIRIPLVLALIGTAGLLHYSGAFAAPESKASSAAAKIDDRVDSPKMNPNATVAVLSNSNSSVESGEDPGIQQLPFDRLSNMDGELTSHDSTGANPSPKSEPTTIESHVTGIDAESHPPSPIDDPSDVVTETSPSKFNLDIDHDAAAIASRFALNANVQGLGKQVATAAKYLATNARSISVVPAREDGISLQVTVNDKSKDRIIIRNSPKSGNSVAFLINKEVRQLVPGESVELPADTKQVVRFHRGGEFGNASASLSAGVFEFQATARGWYLEPIQQNTRFSSD